MRYAIIGNGVAGMTAAQAIREADPAGDIVMFTSEALPFYSRIRLIDYLADRVDESGLVLRKAQWYADNRVELHLETPILKVAPQQREVLAAAGRRFAYDRLLFATGAVPMRPPIPGVDRQGVFTLRTVADGRRIRAAAGQGKKAVLIGGGVLGLEAGWSLLQQGCEVTVVEVIDRLLPRQMDTRGSLLLRQKLQGMGFRFLLGEQCRELSGGDRVAGVRLESGKELAADFVLISAGIIPAEQLAAEAGIAVRRGIVVDERMLTSAPDIYAAGDCVQCGSHGAGLWSSAMEMGRVAGVNMAGGEEVIGNIVPASTLKVAGVPLFSVGRIDADGELSAEVVAGDGRYRKLVFDGAGRPVGAILFGDLAGRRQIAEAIGGGKALSREEGQRLLAGGQ